MRKPLDNEQQHADLATLREEIEAIDSGIVEAIARRVLVARRIGEIKQKTGAPTLDPEREATVVRRAAALSRRLGLPSEEMRALFWLLIGLSRGIQDSDRAAD